MHIIRRLHLDTAIQIIPRVYQMSTTTETIKVYKEKIMNSPQVEKIKKIASGETQPNIFTICEKKLMPSSKYIWISFLIGYITAPYMGSIWKRLGVSAFFFVARLIWSLISKEPMNITENLLIILSANLGWMISRIIYKNVCNYHEVIPEINNVF